MSEAHTNRLARESSPYLLQHAHNPVDWYPWSDEALARACRENKPVLLSVGYSACHWCHVMERECFENDDIARLMNEHFIVSELMKAGVLMHSYKGGVSGIPGYLDDYAFTIRGLLCLHEATLEQRWLQMAFDLADAMVRRFGDEENLGVLYDTGPEQSTLFICPRDTLDSVKPCGGSSATEVLLRLSRITGDGSYEKLAAAMLGLVRDQMLAHPLASGNWLCALDFHLSDPEEVVVVGRRGDPNMATLLTTIHGQYLPKKVLVGFQPDDPVIPLAAMTTKERKMVQGHPTVYLCRQCTCHPPVTDPDQLRRLLRD